MIGKLTGTVGAGSSDGQLIIEVQGVGYSVRVPLLVLPELKGVVSLYIHTAVRDDAIDLYGFPDEEGLAFFKQLMSVSGIGPKTALAIIGVAEPAALRRAIAAGDAGALTKVFGLGKKSAERIVVELRDKLAAQHAAAGLSVGSGGDGEVVEALMALGYSATEARRALKDLKDEGSAGVKERLSAALRHLGSRSVV
ncbi:MAG: Holliday junction branch migration protein RuvA [Patescibacteria group bacterium]